MTKTTKKTSNPKIRSLSFWLKRQDSNLRSPGYKHTESLVKRRSKTTQKQMSFLIFADHSPTELVRQVFVTLASKSAATRFLPKSTAPLGLQAKPGKLVAPVGNTTISKANNTRRTSPLPVSHTIDNIQTLDFLLLF